MRSRSVAVILALVALAFALTNPGRDDFARWFEGRAEAAARGQNGLTRLSLLERAVEVRSSLRRDNYLFFSVFHVHVMRRDHAFVGVLGGFLALGDSRQAVPGSS